MHRKNLTITNKKLSVKKAVDEAWDCIHTRNYPAALQKINAVLREHPSNTRALYGKVLCHEAMKNFGIAERVSLQLLALDRHPNHLRKLGRLYLHIGGKEREAYKLFKEILSIPNAQDHYMNAYLGLAQYFNSQRDLENARKYFDLAVKNYPHHPNPFYAYAHFFRKNGLMKEGLEFCLKTMYQHPCPEKIYIAYVYLHNDMGNYMEAKEFLEKILSKPSATYPTELKLHYARVVMALKRVEEALKIAEDIIAKVPSHPIAYIIKTECLQAMNRIPEAVEFARDVILTAFPGLELSYYNLAMAYESAGDVENNYITLKRAIDEGHVSKDMMMAFGFSLTNLNRYDEALAHFSKMSRTYPFDMRVWLSYIRVLEHSNVDAAEILLKDLMNQFPDCLEPFLGYLLFLHKHKSIEIANKNFNLWKEKFSDRPKYFLTQAINLENRDDRTGAEAMYQEIVTRFPKYVQGYLDYSGFLIAKGFYVEAKEIILKGFDLSPKDKRILTQLGILYSVSEEEPGFIIKAKEFTEAALMIDPRYAPALANQAHLERLKASSKRGVNSGQKSSALFQAAYVSRPERLAKNHRQKEITSLVGLIRREPANEKYSYQVSPIEDVELTSETPVQIDEIELPLPKPVTPVQPKLLIHMSQPELQAEAIRLLTLLTPLKALGEMFKHDVFLEWYSGNCLVLAKQAEKQFEQHEYLGACVKWREILADMQQKIAKMMTAVLRALIEKAQLRSDVKLDDDYIATIKNLFAKHNYADALALYTKLISSLETPEPSVSKIATLLTTPDVEADTLVLLPVLTKEEISIETPSNLTRKFHYAENSNLTKAWSYLKSCCCPAFFSADEEFFTNREDLGDGKITPPTQLRGLGL